MKRLTQKGLIVLSLSVLLVGCAVVDAINERANRGDAVLPGFQAVDISGKLSSEEYTKKIDSFLVILDASSSMGEWHQDAPKLSLATHFLNTMSQTLPEIDIQGALRTFGHSDSVTKDKTLLIQRMSQYDPQPFQSAVSSVVKPGGTSPMASAIDAGVGDLKQEKGRIAVIVVSDWKDLSADVIPSSGAMKRAYGDNLCIYPVILGEDEAGQELMTKVAQVGGCGFAAKASDLTSGRKMANYVVRVFLTTTGDDDKDGVFNPLDKCPGTPPSVPVDQDGCPLDTDKDGVYDHQDRCPGTPTGVKVDNAGCPLDTDEDGVLDYRDECPKTPIGAPVTPGGCWTYGEVLFGTDTAHIKPESYPVLDEIYGVLIKNPKMRLGIEGHTDNQGNEAYNLKLSQERADSVRDYLVEKGIETGKLIPEGFGMSKPRASNETEEGRAINRRVVFTPKY